MANDNAFLNCPEADKLPADRKEAYKWIHFHQLAMEELAGQESAPHMLRIYATIKSALRGDKT